MTSTPEDFAAAIGPWAVASEAYALVTVDVPAEHWIEALTTCRDGLGLAYLDWLSAVDELGEGFSVCAHLALAGSAGSVSHLLLRTRVPRDAAALPTAVPVYAGAAWHERETFEMFGIGFEGHPHLVPLLLPDAFEGHPLRKEFVLAARVAKAWPGAKEPGESSPAEGARRKMLPPGVPDPNEWGPLKGTLPPAPERPARGARAAAGAAGAGPAADRPRRTRSVAAGSTSQAEDTAAPSVPSEAPAAPAASPDMPWQTVDAPAARPRRSRSVSSGSVSQTEPTEPPGEPSAAALEKPAVGDEAAASKPTAAADSASASAPPAPEAREAAEPEPATEVAPQEPGAATPEATAADSTSAPAPAAPEAREAGGADEPAAGDKPNTPEAPEEGA